MKKKPNDMKKEVSAELRGAHAALLRVSTQEAVHGINHQLKRFGEAIAAESLIDAHNALTALQQKTMSVRREVEHSAKQLGIDLWNDDDEDDEDDEDDC